MDLTVATYNVLADGYIRRKYYPGIPSALLNAARRRPRVADRVAGLDADVVCLQECDRQQYRLLRQRLAEPSYASRWLGRGGNRPDGCAIFVRQPWRCLQWLELNCSAIFGQPDSSGRVALMAVISDGQSRLVVATTHVKWDAPGAVGNQRVGLLHGQELLRFLASWAVPKVLCGDFNAEPTSPLLAACRAAGYADAHPASVMTGNFGRLQKIDYLLHTPELVAWPRQPPGLTAADRLPSPSEPSDHLPLVSGFRLAD